MEPQDVILFDGVCNLCNDAVNFIIDHDKHRRFRFASLQSSYAQDKLSSFKVDTSTLDSIVLIKGNGQLKIKSSAALHIARRLSGAWPLCYAFIILPPFIRDYLYDIIAKNRYRWFGRRDECRIPTPEVKGLFLDI